jgi:hypothetical protein
MVAARTPNSENHMPENHDQWRASAPRPAPQPPPALHNAILTRVIGLVRGFTGLAGALSLGVLAAEATLPPPYKPSTLIGGFHGRIEAADATAKSEATSALTRKNAEAAAQPPAFATMESDAFRQQQQVLADSLQTQSTIANTADAACIAGQLVPHDNRDYGWLGDLLRSACGVGDQVRQNMVDILRQGGQNNSVLIERPRAGGER